MNKLKTHIERWKVWRNYDSSSKLYQVLVLLGLVRSSSFEYTLLPYERPTKFFYENDKFSSCGEVEKGVKR